MLQYFAVSSKEEESKGCRGSRRVWSKSEQNRVECSTAQYITAWHGEEGEGGELLTYAYSVLGLHMQPSYDLLVGQRQLPVREVLIDSHSHDNEIRRQWYCQCSRGK